MWVFLSVLLCIFLSSLSKFSLFCRPPASVRENPFSHIFRAPSRGRRERKKNQQKKSFTQFCIHFHGTQKSERERSSFTEKKPLRVKQDERESSYTQSVSAELAARWTFLSIPRNIFFHFSPNTSSAAALKGEEFCELVKTRKHINYTIINKFKD